MKETFKKLITNFQERSFGTIIPRDYDIPTETNKTVSLIGVRHYGKTHILFSLVEKLRKAIAKGIAEHTKLDLKDCR